MVKPIVLVIEDNPWSISLEDWHEVITDVEFKSITDPREVFKTSLEGVLCILLDHNMPHHNGDVIAHFLRDQGYTGKIYKIGALDEPGYPADCIRVGKMLTYKKIRAMLSFARGETDVLDLG